MFYKSIDESTPNQSINLNNQINQPTQTPQLQEGHRQVCSEFGNIISAQKNKS
jgi:hypothetical protein